MPRPSPHIILASLSQASHQADDNSRRRSPKHSRPVVKITLDARRGYWLVAITCKDRNKLLFDTVCTLADMDYEVFHATIDSRNGVAMQEYWIKSRNGCTGAYRG